MDINTHYEEFVLLYEDGLSIGSISEHFGIKEEEVYDCLEQLKSIHKQGRGFDDDFKKIVAMRDKSEVSRRQLSAELSINIATVKKACEKFGQSVKSKDAFENYYKELDKHYDLTSCPECNSKKMNEVDDNTYYCFDCGNEFFNKEDKTYCINWEYID